MNELIIIVPLIASLWLGAVSITITGLRLQRTPKMKKKQKMKSFSAGRYWGKRHAFEGKHTSKWCELTIKLNKAEGSEDVRNQLVTLSFVHTSLPIY